ncbi:hypothetical protein G3M48_000775 [Beauveria asiatica]|uniref:Glycosyltransferase 2-like domain-containing protein n=1 Tax=Beauveria asiatica TaxID=1069075 RepID=A0AAW0S089_9HYPO
MSFFGSNVACVRKTIAHALRSIGEAPAEVVLLTDEPFNKDLYHVGIRMVAVPGFFTTKAKFKARALEYFRITERLGPDDWTLHLDEETLVDRATVDACRDFIAHEHDFQIGQGLVFYNGCNYWIKSLLAVADVARVADDLGKLYLQNFVIHVPYWGLRGSFLLINGAAENTIGWESDNLTEDYDFSWKVTLLP